MSEDTCSTCRWWQPYETEPRLYFRSAAGAPTLNASLSGLCRRYPPDANGYASAAAYDDFCGEHAPDLTQEPAGAAP